jgi:hypothetical protein
VNKVRNRILNLIAQFNGLEVYFDEPESLEIELIQSLKSESERCCKAILDLLAKTRQQLSLSDLGEQSTPARHDKVQMNGIDTPNIASQFVGSARITEMPPRPVVNKAVTWAPGTGSSVKFQ